MLGDEDATVRMFAAEALAKIDPHAIPQLIRVVDDPHGDISMYAVYTVGSMGSSAIPILVEMLENEDAVIRSYVVAMFAAIGPPAAPALIEVLKNKNYHARWCAVEILIFLSDDFIWEGRVGIAGLIVALHDRSIRIREHTTDALVETGPPAIPALIEALDDKDSVALWHVCEALRRIGFSARDALPKLKESAKEGKSADVRNAAREAAGQILFEIRVRQQLLSRPSRGNIPSLIESLDSVDGDVRSHATHALIKIGPPAAAALKEALKHKKWEVRHCATGALSLIGPAGVPGLIIALSDESDFTRTLAAQALGKIGLPAKDALPKLKGLTREDENVDVRNAAKEAIRTIQRDIEACAKR